MAEGELNQVNYGAIGVPPSKNASPTRARRRTDSFRPKGVGATFWAEGSARMKSACRDDRPVISREMEHH
jgi:hypothetical protein